MTTSLRSTVWLTVLVLAACGGGASTTPCQPSQETCDGKDNDCNGQVDEGLGVTTCGAGACQRTVPACDGGLPGVCVPGAPQAELCNGIDDSCDGQVDEGCECLSGQTQPCYGGPAATQGVGACHAGEQPCDAGQWGACAGDQVPAAESCNGLDDDCNGQVDDGLGDTTCGLGACTMVVAACTNGTPGTCTPGTPTTETCNGVDDNCDGATDEGNPGGGASCSTGLLGVCAAGTTTCRNGAVTCLPGTTASAEVCDGLDNDCNGQVDEGVVSTYHPDADRDGYGNPGASVQACSAPAGHVADGADCDDANATVHPGAPETCNGRDDDCDGQVDEGNPGGGSACLTGNPGICSAGTTACQAGTITCSQNTAPTAEVCNGLDDNCDGITDEGVPVGASCLTGLLGACAAGTTACLGGAMACVQSVNASVELCDGIDNDCDGVIDEGVKTTYYRDLDGDGFGNPSTAVQACSQPGGYVNVAADCNDTNASIHPGATEFCNSVDDDCDTTVDEGNPGGGAVCTTGLGGACNPGTVQCTGGALVCRADLPGC